MTSPTDGPPLHDVRWCRFETPLGAMVLAATSAGLCGAWFEDQRHFSGVHATWRLQPDDAGLTLARVQLDEWFQRRRTKFELPLAPHGTLFQQRVWTALQAIAPSQTTSYGQLARELGLPKAARAVGAATGRNPCSIVIPCHRLLAGSGALTGYAGGIERKRALLAFEQGANWP